MNQFNYEIAALDLSTSIEASAGTGKTYTIEHLIFRFLTEQIKGRSLSIDQVLVVTFTEKATREMKERIRSLLQKKLTSLDQPSHKKFIEKALRGFNQSAIHTIHGFCQRVLKEFNFHSNAPLAIEHAPDSEFIINAIWDLFRKKDIGEAKYFLLQTAFQLKNHQEVIEFIFKSYQHKLFDEDYNLLLPEYNQPESSRDLDVTNFLQEITQNNPFKTPLNDLKAVFNGPIGKDLIDDLAHLNKAIYKTHKIPQDLFDLKALSNVDDYFELMGILTKKANKKAKIEGLTKFTQSEIKKKLLKKSNYEDLKCRDFYSHLEKIDREFHYQQDLLIQYGVYLLKAILTNLKRDLDSLRKELGIQTFDDQILDLEYALKKYPSLATALNQKYKVILIDEFQDTDPHQWRIFKSAFLDKGTPTFLIGDPKQSIYTFRGANLNTYFKAKQDERITEHKVLKINYRSNPTLIQGFNILFSRLFQESELEYLEALSPRDEVQNKASFQPIQLYFLNDENEKMNVKQLKDKNIDFIINGIKNLKKTNTQLSLREIAILTSKNKEAKELKARLSEEGLPAVLSVQANIWHTREADDILIVLKAIRSPNNITNVLAIFYTAFFQLNHNQVLEIKKHFLSLFQHQLSHWRGLIEEQKIIKVKEELFNWTFSQAALELSPYIQRQLSTLEGERTVTNVEHIFERLNQSKEHRTIDELIDYIEMQQSQSSEAEEDLIRLETEKEGVSILTMHASKGLEFSYVFLHAGLGKANPDSNKFYQYFEGEKRVYDFKKSEDSKTKAVAFEQEELCRLFYVAITRAKTQIYIPIFQPNGKSTADLILFWTRILGEAPTQANLTCLLKFKSIFKLAKNLKEIPKENQIENRPPLLLTPPPKPNWHRHVNAYPGVTSFSQLEKSLTREDDVQPLWNQSMDGSFGPKEEENIYTFAKGPKIGNLLHLIFEKINFKIFESLADVHQLLKPSTPTLADVSKTIDQIARQFFDARWASKYGNYLKTIVWRSLKTKLAIGDETFCLASLADEDKVHEIEFLFSVNKSSLIYPGTHSRLEIDKNGYLKGFIDLLFRFKGKYYLADWKSNSLGPDASYYQMSNLAEAMEAHHYHWQSLIYTLATCQYLNLQKDFNYEKHFGGVYYFFIRGMAPDKANSSQGVYFNRFSKTELEEFSKNCLKKTLHL